MAKKPSMNKEAGMTAEDIQKRKDLVADRLIPKIEKRFGQGSVFLGNQALEVDVISTGSIAVDSAIGVGGVPRGRIVEIYGPESSGKTTLTLHIIAEAQRAGGVCAFVDMEHALDPSWARRIGVNVDELYMSQPDTGEEALEISQEFISSGLLDVVVVDSVAALVPRAEIEGEMGDSHVGLQARLMSQALRKLAGIVRQSNCIVIFTNQLREKVGIRFGSPETTSGGRALKFYASVRLDIRRIQAIKAGGQNVGNRTRVKVTKNKVSAPFQEAEFDIMFDEGISTTGEILDIGVEADIISKSGAYYKYNDEIIGQGRENAKEKMREDDYVETTFEIHNKVREYLGIPPLEAMPVYNKLKNVALGEAAQDPKKKPDGEIEREDVDE